jgi:hypothetical protein
VVSRMMLLMARKPDVLQMSRQEGGWVLNTLAGDRERGLSLLGAEVSEYLGAGICVWYFPSRQGGGVSLDLKVP